MGLAIGQNLLITELGRAVPRYTAAVTSDQVLASGVGGLSQLASSSTLLEALRHAYTQATRHVLILGLACACLTLPPAFAMEWRNITHESQRRKKIEADDKGEQVRPIEGKELGGGN